MKGPNVAWNYLPSKGDGSKKVTLPLGSMQGVMPLPFHESDEPNQEDEDTGGPMRENSVMRDLDADTNKLFERLPAMFKRMLETHMEQQRIRLRSDMASLLANHEINIEKMLLVQGELSPKVARVVVDQKQPSPLCSKDLDGKGTLSEADDTALEQSVGRHSSEPGKSVGMSVSWRPGRAGQPRSRPSGPSAPSTFFMGGDSDTQTDGGGDGLILDLVSDMSQNALTIGRRPGMPPVALKKGSATRNNLLRGKSAAANTKDGTVSGFVGGMSQGLGTSSWKRGLEGFIKRDDMHGQNDRMGKLPPGSRARRMAEKIEEMDKRRNEAAWERASENGTESDDVQHKSVRTLTPQEKVSHMITDVRFELLVFVLIFANVVCVGIEVDMSTRTGSEFTEAFLWVDTGFTCCFLCELLLRVFAQRWDFFTPKQRLWNLFDFFVVLTAILELLISFFLSGSSVSLEYIRFIRILRVTRFLRAVRLIRLLRFIRALRTLVQSIFATLKSLIWALLLIVMVFYGFGMAITQSVGQYIHTHEEYDPDLARFWGSLAISMFTLYKSITGGINWHTVVTPLNEVGPTMVFLFIFYVTFTFFAVLNVITGVFCQSAIDSAQQDKEMLAIHQMANRERTIAMMKALFQEIDEDDSGAISIEEFERYLTNDEVKAYFASLDIDVTDAWMLFKLLDKDDGGSISLEEFLEGCLSIKGDAKAIHVVKLQQDNRFLRELLQCYMEDMYVQFDGLSRQVRGGTPGNLGMQSTAGESGIRTMSMSNNRVSTGLTSGNPAQ